ncbi:MAG: AI-2E family transporter, partial [Acidobacteria bacterium]|nr:AI-2E family transporter [Acidobacteriota bacterium]
VSEGVNIHPVLVILAVVCGAELGGMVGVFLSVPVVALLLVCIRHWRTLTFTPARVAGAGQRVGGEDAHPSN